jgi:hypothetical protein
MGSTSKFKRPTFDNLSMLKRPTAIPVGQNVNVREILKNPSIVLEDDSDDFENFFEWEKENVDQD